MLRYQTSLPLTLSSHVDCDLDLGRADEDAHLSPSPRARLRTNLHKRWLVGVVGREGIRAVCRGCEAISSREAKPASWRHLGKSGDRPLGDTRRGVQGPREMLLR
jgi:hypothetical protein